ncbi:thioredoxin reductase 1, cytoplasmic-like isoform X3 [Mugil cephalus]|uniref:thioredoxin reductase 1, cytoplasmic-like isoform X3 n=1 Tax=Mugil cephalus TaxID=48193 RepID=UPI001FB5FD5B|nr:thioredoxin reductase 1, cytoplasmic-like isoform X3 [Mugil cephalus]
MDPPDTLSPGLYDYDLLVIGGGSGGLAVAKEAAGFMKKVLFLDLLAPSPRGAERGSCSDIDSIRKFLQQASLLRQAIQDSQKYGWRFKQEVLHDWSELVQAVQGQVRSASLELKRELRSCGVSHLNAHGRIVAPRTVEVTDVDGRKRRLTAETLVVATGTTPQCLCIPGETEYCITSKDLLSLPRPPGRTLVVGGSAEGLECAGFLSGLGLPVTVALTPDLLPGFDQKTARKIENHMIVAGVDFLYRCSLSKVEQTKDATSAGDSAAAPQQGREGTLRVTVISKEGQTLQKDFDTVLVAVGRKACTSDIGLESVGVQRCRDGRILVNERDQTSVDHIYAIGSVQHGRRSATGLSVHAGKLLARRLYGGGSVLCDYTCVPTVVLTPLEYAACGLSEEKAKLTFGEANVEAYHSHYWPLEWILPARNKNSCYVKVVCHIPDHERVVGLHIMGPNAGDILQGFAAAMKCGLTKQQLDATVGIHPGSAQVLTSLTQTQRMSEALMVRGNC